jgi:hypothetical protein
MSNLEIICPGCDSILVIDRESGAVVYHKPKPATKASGGSLDAMVSSLEAQKSEMEKRFDRQLESQKDRGRLLEERFKEALQRADKSDEKPFNPMDD